MLYYTEVCLSPYEVPDNKAICIYISGCMNRCAECHYPLLQRNDYGDLLADNFRSIIELYRAYATCVCFFGEGRNAEEEHKEFEGMISYAKKHGLKTCLYCGRNTEIEPWMMQFDYIKTGSFQAEFGGLNERTTNQKMYEKINGEYRNVTHKFWKQEG